MRLAPSLMSASADLDLSHSAPLASSSSMTLDQFDRMRPPRQPSAATNDSDVVGFTRRADAPSLSGLLPALPIASRPDKLHIQCPSAPQDPPAASSQLSDGICTPSSLSLSSGIRTPTLPLKQPRISNLQAESRSMEAEVESEAAFQRLVASVSELPIPSNRSRDYPQEPEHEDDEDVDSGHPSKHRRTQSEDYFTWFSDEDVSMAVDMPHPHHSPPPSSAGTPTRGVLRSASTSSRNRSARQRAEPYATAAQRRTFSPYPRHVSPHSGESRHQRLPISVPGSPKLAKAGSLSNPSSPVSRVPKAHRVSVLAPYLRFKRNELDEELNVAGAAVSSLTLG